MSNRDCGMCQEPGCPKCYPSHDLVTLQHTVQRHHDHSDPINPKHYDGDACMRAIEECTKDLDGTEGYLTGVMMKYLWRWKEKDGLQDLQKTKWYLERLIKYKTDQLTKGYLEGGGK